MFHVAFSFSGLIRAFDSTKRVQGRMLRKKGRGMTKMHYGANLTLCSTTRDIPQNPRKLIWGSVEGGARLISYFKKSFASRGNGMGPRAQAFPRESSILNRTCKSVSRATYFSIKLFENLPGPPEILRDLHEI